MLLYVSGARTAHCNDHVPLRGIKWIRLVKLEVVKDSRVNTFWQPVRGSSTPLDTDRPRTDARPTTMHAPVIDEMK